MSTPRLIRSRASRENFTSLAAMSGSLSTQIQCGNLSGAHPEDVAFLHADQVLARALDLGARPFAEQDPIAFLDVERSHLAVLGTSARADRDHFAFLRLFLRRIGNDDPARGLLLGLDPADEDTVMKRP